MRWAETEEGFGEAGVCDIGDFLLARWLMRRLLNSGFSRVVMRLARSRLSPPKLDFDRTAHE